MNRNQFTHHLNTKHLCIPTAEQPVYPGVKNDDIEDDNDDEEKDDNAEQTNPADYTTTWCSDTVSNIVNEGATLNDELASDDVMIKQHQIEKMKHYSRNTDVTPSSPLRGTFKLFLFLICIIKCVRVHILQTIRL